MTSPTATSLPMAGEILRLAVEASGDCVLLLALDGKIVDLHGTSHAHLGPVSGENVIGRAWADRFEDDGREKAEAALIAAKSGRRASFTARLANSGQDGGYWHNTVLPFGDGKGPPSHLLVVSRDVTDSHFARNELELKSRLHQALIRATAEIVWHFDVARDTIERRGWSDFTGSETPVEDKDAWLLSVHPDDRERTRLAIEGAIAARSPCAIEYRLRHRSGQWRWVEDRAVPLVSTEGTLTDWIGVVSDTSERRATEHELRRSEERVRLAIEATNLGTWDVDVATGARRWSIELKSMLGLGPDEPESEALLLECVHPEDRETVATHNRTTFLQADGSPSATFRIVRRDTGELRWINSKGRVVLDANGHPSRRIGTFQDVTEQHETRQALRLALRRYEALIEATSEIVWSADATQVTGDGSGWTEFTGQAMPAAEGEGWLQSVHPDDRAKVKRTCESALASATPYTNEYRLRHVSGQWRWVIDRAIPLVDDDGALAEWVGIISDIHDRKTVEDQVWRVAHTDELTGLANRTLFQVRLEEAVRSAPGHGGRLGLLLIDLDRFKEVNDSLGHDAGDVVLSTVARRLASCVPEGATVARLGGDEFGVILPDAEPARMEAIAAEILSCLKQPLRHAGRELDCSATIGFAVLPSLDAEPSALLKDADIALYAAKAAGRGQAFAFAPAMREELDRRISVLRDAKAALVRDAIIPFYQPKISLSDGSIVGFEALLRWTDGSGLRSPGAIREAFDDHELSSRIGSVMLSKVVADMENWARSGLAFGSVALNAAAPEFHQPGFTESILFALSEASLPTSSLEIEVTESVLLETATDSVERALWRLHEAGIAISLDDFGTGYASLTHLKTFPVSWLKLDRSFVSNLDKDKDSAAIVRAVLNLARSIGIRVVAEGVETERQFQFLQRHRCDAAQGFLLSKPMAASRVPYFLSSWGKSSARSPSPVHAV